MIAYYVGLSFKLVISNEIGHAILHFTVVVVLSPSALLTEFLVIYWRPQGMCFLTLLVFSCSSYVYVWVSPALHITI